MDNQSVFPLPSPSTSELGVVKDQVLQLVQAHKDLQTYRGHDTVDLDGVKFDLLLQTINWVSLNLPSSSYYVFLEINTFVDALGASHLCDKDFIDECFNTSKLS